MARLRITNEEKALEAIRQNGLTLRYVPRNHRTAKLCLEAVRRDGYGAALYYVPRNLKTADICLEAVKQFGLALEHVPENLKTADICLEAVKNLLEKDLEIVPEPLRDEVRRALKSGA